jgi:hypothetical protein
MNKVKTREIRLKGLDFPTFLYDENTNYEADDIAKGLLRGKLLVKVSTELWTSISQSDEN